MTSNVIPFPLTPASERRLWAAERRAFLAYQTAWNAYESCPCKAHEVEKERAKAAWEPALNAIDAGKTVRWGR